MHSSSANKTAYSRWQASFPPRDVPPAGSRHGRSSPSLLIRQSQLFSMNISGRFYFSKSFIGLLKIYNRRMCELIECTFLASKQALATSLNSLHERKQRSVIFTVVCNAYCACARLFVVWLSLTVDSMVNAQNLRKTSRRYPNATKSFLVCKNYFGAPEFS